MRTLSRFDRASNTHSIIYAEYVRYFMIHLERKIRFPTLLPDKVTDQGIFGLWEYLGCGGSARAPCMPACRVERGAEILICHFFGPRTLVWLLIRPIMARNEEKAATMYNKWQDFKKAAHSEGSSLRRPNLASECTVLSEAEKWRRELLKDVTRKISAIHNATLGEHRIRELNDEINKTMRVKHRWEMRIVELGGNDYRKIHGSYDVEGKELPGAHGYKYYGAAKELPGVRELFAEATLEATESGKKRDRVDIYKSITPDYYGFRDDGDGTLLRDEETREKQLRKEDVRIYLMKREALTKRAEDGDIFAHKELKLLEDDDEEDALDFTNVKQISVAVNASVGKNLLGPDQIEAEIVQSRKRALLGQFQ
jgi:pre-mRNA-splicing factor ISY1